MLIDTHAHVNFKDFKDDFDEVIKRAHLNNVVMINVGSQLSTSIRAMEIAQNYNNVFASVGLHPIQLEDQIINEEHASFRSRAEDFNYEEYLTLAQQNKVVAIGECGLDYYHVNNKEGELVRIKNKQKEVLIQQVKLANEVGLPMIIHCRGSQENPIDAYVDLFELLKNNLPKKRGVIHCFLGDLKLAQDFVELGFYLGVNGVVTFDKTDQVIQIVKNINLDKLVVETDCPYLTPVPFRGKRNEPSYVEYVIQKISEIKQLQYEEVVIKTTQNAKSLFNLQI